MTCNTPCLTHTARPRTVIEHMSKFRLIAILIALFWVLAKVGVDLAHAGGAVGAITGGDGLVPLFAILGLGAAVALGLNTLAGAVLAVAMMAWLAFGMGFGLSLGDGESAVAAVGGGTGMVGLLIAGAIVAVVASGSASKLWWLAIPAALVLLPRIGSVGLGIDTGATSALMLVTVCLGAIALTAVAVSQRTDASRSIHERFRDEMAQQTLADSGRRADEKPL
jgi:hypothetical protein